MVIASVNDGTYFVAFCNGVTIRLTIPSKYNLQAGGRKRGTAAASLLEANMLRLFVPFLPIYVFHINSTVQKWSPSLSYFSLLASGWCQGAFNLSLFKVLFLRRRVYMMDAASPWGCFGPCRNRLTRAAGLGWILLSLLGSCSLFTLFIDLPSPLKKQNSL